jgi:hypothetical protein
VVIGMYNASLASPDIMEQLTMKAASAELWKQRSWECFTALRVMERLNPRRHKVVVTEEVSSL